jgi:hypothetical protein
MYSKSEKNVMIFCILLMFKRVLLKLSFYSLYNEMHMYLKMTPGVGLFGFVLCPFFTSVHVSLK